MFNLMMDGTIKMGVRPGIIREKFLHWRSKYTTNAFTQAKKDAMEEMLECVNSIVWLIVFFLIMPLSNVIFFFVRSINSKLDLTVSVFPSVRTYRSGNRVHFNAAENRTKNRSKTVRCLCPRPVTKIHVKYKEHIYNKINFFH